MTPIFRRATPADLPALIAMLADDPLGAAREDLNAVPSAGYSKAFEAVDRDPNAWLMVVEQNDAVAGMFQLNYLAGLSRNGALRAQVEAVRVARDFRGQGLGKQMFAWIFDHCLARECHFVQLTSDTSRRDAHRFYQTLGFIPSHTGFKKTL